jgi:hypothetical protein
MVEARMKHINRTHAAGGNQGEKMKLAIFFVAACAVLAGCAVGSGDSRMASVEKTTVTLDGLPVYVKILKVSGKTNIYDVEAGDGRAIPTTDLQPLIYISRFKEAAEMELRRKYGKDAKITQIAEFAPTGDIRVWIRYSVIP